jgi:hypothetical protein
MEILPDKERYDYEFADTIFDESFSDSYDDFQ